MRRWKLYTGIFLLVTVAAAVWTWSTARPARPQPWTEGLPRPCILAHQGGEKEWPTNTMYAFTRARKAGSDAVDMDLQMSRDKVLVLIHDTTVDRTTNGQGGVADLTWAELEKLDAAYRFSLDGKTYPLRGKGVKIPRLDEVLEAFPDWRIQIEVKEAPLDIADELAKLLKEKNAEGQILLSSFHGDLMRELRRACPNVASSATPNEIKKMVLASCFHVEGLLSPDYCAFQVPMSRYGIPLVSRRIVDAAHARGVTVLPWTIDLDEEVEICRQAGVDGFNTNLPTKMEAVRETW